MTIENNFAGSSKPGTPERSALLEEIFKKYHKELLRWCSHKLRQRKLGNNLKTDSEDIISYMYQELLRYPVPVDLTREEVSIRAFLNKALDYAIGHFVVKKDRMKRNPEGGIISLDELLEEGEENLSWKLKQYLGVPSTEITIEINNEIEKALLKFEPRNEKKADIIRKRFLLNKTLKEIADEYGQSIEDIIEQEKKGLRKLRVILTKMSNERHLTLGIQAPEKM